MNIGYKFYLKWFVILTLLEILDHRLGQKGLRRCPFPKRQAMEVLLIRLESLKIAQKLGNEQVSPGFRSFFQYLYPFLRNIHLLKKKMFNFLNLKIYILQEMLQKFSWVAQLNETNTYLQSINGPKKCYKIFTSALYLKPENS